MPRRRLYTLLFTATCLCALAWAAPLAHATPTWLPAQPISTPPETTTIGVAPTVTMGPSGDIAAVWALKGVVYADVRQAGSLSFTEQQISKSTHSASAPSLAINASGKGPSAPKRRSAPAGKGSTSSLPTAPRPGWTARATPLSAGNISPKTRSSRASTTPPVPF